MPVHLLANAAHERNTRKIAQPVRGVGCRQIGTRDDGVRPAVRIRHRLYPRGFGMFPALRPVGLDVDRTGHAATGTVLKEFGDRVVSPDGLVGPEDPRLHRSEQPRQIGAAPDVVVCVDDHRSSRTCPITPRQSAAALSA